MDIIQKALTCSRCVISIIGDHAEEEIKGILCRKMDDIKKVGKTFWLYKSQKAKPDDVQRLCRTTPAFVLFINSASKTSRPTKIKNEAKEYRENDGEQWRPFPEGMGKVTGKLDPQAYALVFDELTTAIGAGLDLWDYADFTDPQQPLKFRLGCSTIIEIQKNMKSHPNKLKSPHRPVVAVARLVAPYCVWVR